MASTDIKQQNRIEWIDQYRGFLMYMVFLTHLHSPSWLCQFMYPVFLTGFFSLSGYLYTPKPFRVHMFSIFNTLLVPFFLYSIIIAALEAVKFGDLSVYTHYFFNNFILGGDQFWFIPCLIIVEFIFYSFKYFFKKHHHTVFLFVICFLSAFYITDNNTKHHLPWNADTAIWSLSFYSLGGVYMFKKEVAKTVIFGSIILYFCLCVILGLMGLGCEEDDMHMNYIQCPMCYMILAIVGCYALIHTFPILPTIKLFSTLGKYTLIAFPFQPYVLRIFEKIAKAIINEPLYDQFYTLIIIIISLATSTVFSIVGILLFRHMPILLGKVKILK